LKDSTYSVYDENLHLFFTPTALDSWNADVYVFYIRKKRESEDSPFICIVLTENYKLATADSKSASEVAVIVIGTTRFGVTVTGTKAE
jgi:hypothetical protein